MVKEPEKSKEKDNSFLNIEGPEKHEFGTEFEPKNPHKMFKNVREIDVDGQGKKKS